MPEHLSASDAKKAKEVAPARFNMHIYLYLVVAMLLLCIGSSIGCFWLADNRSPDDWQVFVVLIGPVLVLVLVWLALSRCSIPEFSGFRGLLYITAYMSSGVGSYSAIIAVPAAMVAVLGTVVIAGASLVNADKTFAPRQFARLVMLYYRHRMYQ